MNTKRIAVAMSGGVDSSVAAALLKDKGFDVIGVTMQLGGSSRRRGDDGRDQAKLAKRVARRLSIPHYVFNFRELFRKKVITNFCEEYKMGRTPNPCVRCNKYIKFGILLKKAKELGADYIATGHYARVAFDRKRKRYLLKKGIDAKKDQSYFLFALSQQQLKHTLTPLGELTKNKVRQIAKEKSLPVAAALESQQICFIPDNRCGEFLKTSIPQRLRKTGPIVNKQGKVIGRHQGIIFYTVGQRKGIGIADKEPLYVTSIDRKNNAIIVGKREDGYRDELIADNVNFIYLDKLKRPLKVRAKVRYLHPAASATISPLGRRRLRVKFAKRQWAITPGQAAVFYLAAGQPGLRQESPGRADIVIAGGTISSN